MGRGSGQRHRHLRSGGVDLNAGRLLSNGQKVPVERPDWIKFTKELVDAGAATYKAAQTKNQDVVTVSLDRLSNACDSCHEVYRDKH